jgi:hypothetical protein
MQRIVGKHVNASSKRILKFQFQAHKVKQAFFSSEFYQEVQVAAFFGITPCKRAEYGCAGNVVASQCVGDSGFEFFDGGDHFGVTAGLCRFDGFLKGSFWASSISSIF